MTKKNKSNRRGSFANREVLMIQKANLFNRISNRKYMTQKCTLSSFQHSNKMKLTGKGIVESQMDIEAVSIHANEAILMNILSRLPVRSLLQFKCVSKFWKNVISDPYFKMKHLNHAKNDQNSQKLLISQRFWKDDSLSMYCCPLSSEQLVDHVQKLDVPSSSKPRQCRILCCCDGLATIRVFDDCSTHLLWNPSTRESIVLPEPEFSWEAIYRMGMIYDSTGGDYKILGVFDDTNELKLPSEILALKSDSWRKIDEHPHGFRNVLSDMRALPFVNRAFHWIGVSSNLSVISFSVSNEVYGEIPLPEQILITGHNRRFSIGRIALCSFYLYTSQHEHY